MNCNVNAETLRSVGMWLYTVVLKTEIGIPLWSLLSLQSNLKFHEHSGFGHCCFVEDNYETSVFRDSG